MCWATRTAVWNRQISSMTDLTVTAASQSGREAFAMAGLTPKDIDVVQLYDAFTINTLLFLEDLGFCPKGEGGRFVADGAIAPGGALPVNTNGGGLSCVHPGMYGIFALIEAVRQLRGDCGERQVKNARTALAHGNGGMLSSQATRHSRHRRSPLRRTDHDPRPRNPRPPCSTPCAASCASGWCRPRTLVAETDAIPADIVREMKATGPVRPDRCPRRTAASASRWRKRRW